jgi:hypothetical protein
MRNMSIATVDGHKTAPVYAMELRCPSCNSTDLKKVSLAYQGGLHRVKTRTRLVGLVFGDGGADLVGGRAATGGVQQTELSKVLSPPRKWSYVRLIFGSLVVTLAALFAYVVFVASSAPPVSTLPMKMYVLLAPVGFLVLVFLFWRHNHVRFPQEYAQWNRSFMCQRCGTVSIHEVPRGSLPQS